VRFVAKYKKYNVIFQREIVEHYATGEQRTLQPYIDCQFDLYGSMLPHEIEAAREQFINYGLPVEVDGVTTIDPLYRFSVFDSVECQRLQGFDDAKRVELEQFLLNRPECGVDYILVEAPRLAPPWPTYDSFRGVRGLPTAEAIAKRVQEDGYEVAEVHAYERQNQNRQEVLDALEALLLEEPAGEQEELIEA